jgi:hypothetical protein
VYGALWVVDKMLRILASDARSLSSEPIDPTESRCIEFVLILVDGSKEFWSVKMQTGMTDSITGVTNANQALECGPLAEQSPKGSAIF